MIIILRVNLSKRNKIVRIKPIRIILIVIKRLWRIKNTVNYPNLVIRDWMI